MRERAFATRYGIAVAACAAALALRAALEPWLGGRFPFIFLYPAVALAAWLGGLGPALVVALPGALGVWWLSEAAAPHPAVAPHVANLVGATIFLFAAVSIGLLGELARRAARRAADSERATGEALRKVAESERLYRAAGELVPFGIWVADARGRATYLSRSLLDVLGVSFTPGSDEWALRIEPADYDRVVTAWQRAVDEGAPSFEQEFRIRGKDGEVRSVLSRGEPLRDGASGAVTAWVGVHLDVTASRSAERDLARLAAIVESSDDAIVAKSPEGIITSFNPGAERIFGWRADEVIGRHLSILLPPDRADEFPAIMRRLRAGERIDHYETVRQRKDGTLIDVSVTISPLRDAAGNLIGASKVARDVTADKRTSRALRESEARFRALADSAPVLIWVNGLEGCEFVNRSYALFVGMPLEALRGTGWTAAVHPDDLTGYLDAYARALAARAPFDAQVRLRGGGADGAYRWHQSVGHPRLTPDGALLGYVGVSFDISQIKASEAALIEADRRKDDFLAMLGHELRNPLAPIRNAARVLTADGAHERAWARDVIDRQVRHLTRLVDDLLDVSRITRGKVALRRARVAIAAPVRFAVETVRPLADQRGQALDVELPDEELFVDADEARLAQVIQNLLHNATKFTPEGGHIRLSVARDGAAREAVLRVRDDGCGIAPDLLDDVFEPFAQADRSLDRADGGLGIGLTLVKTLVELHGGRVEARSAGAGRGSEFTVRLPLAEAPVESSAEPQTESEGEPSSLSVRASGPNGRGNGLRVLVVDDNYDSARSMSLVLNHWGHKTEVARDGHEALDRTDAFHPDVVLLDIGLPGMSGYDVARELRRRPVSRDVLLVAMTGYGQSEDLRRSAESGFDHHLVKPVDLSTVQRLLSAARARWPQRSDENDPSVVR